MKKILILKDRYNSFEQYYMKELNRIVDTMFYYKNSTKIRKMFTHFGLPFDYRWYGEWKDCLNDYDIIIVFDSLHTSKLLKYIYKNSKSRVIYWHWNPIRTIKEKKILRETKEICEHWTFNPVDSEEYGMKLNNQFFFFQNNLCKEKEKKAFFVGTDKGRYDKLLELAGKLENANVEADFHVIDSNKTGRFYQNKYMDYKDVLEKLKVTKAVVEIVQSGQNGLTARALEAMFFKTKLITNNSAIKECVFYKKENIFVIGDNEGALTDFLESSFVDIEEENIYPYSAQGWIEKFVEE